MKSKFNLFFKKATKTMMVFILLLMFVIITLVILIWIWSPGKPEPFVDGKGNVLINSISEKVFVDINGMKQGMFIKGYDSTKPILLYVHGGLPFYFLTEGYPIGLEKDFVLVWWEQRGIGISYSPNVKIESINSDTLVSDLLAVTNYLRQRFSQDKIYLMGHSGGSFIGIKAAAKSPELFYAYIGLSQMSNQMVSEKIAYDFMLKKFYEEGNTKMLQKLRSSPVTQSSIPKEYLAIRDEAMHSLGIGTMRSMKSVVKDIFLHSLSFKEYTIVEKFNFWRAKANAGVSIIWKEILNTDLSSEITELKLPVYFLEGIYDYTCSYDEAKSFFIKLDAPLKGFYTFHNSAHSPIFEEPEKSRQIFLVDILNNSTSLADTISTYSKE